MLFMVFLLVFVGVQLAFSGDVQATSVESNTAERLPFALGEMIVKYKNGSTKNALSVGNAGNLQKLRDLPQANTQLMRIPQSHFSTKGLKVKEDLLDETLAVINEIRKQPNVELVQPNFYYYRMSSTPNDPNFGALWGLQALDTEAAWEISTGAGVNVAVIDTGTDPNHEDLQGNIALPGYHAGNRNNNQYVDPSEDDHGTHVSGTITAVKDNGKGIVGIAPEAKIIPVNILTGTQATTADIVWAIEQLKTRGVKITNNSYGANYVANSFETGDDIAFKDAIADSGMLFVVAAGNEGIDNDNNQLQNSDVDYCQGSNGDQCGPAWPASFQLPNLITVAATDSDENLATFSNYGSSRVHVGAPGVNIWSTLPGNMYGSYSGTSMAAPHVAGVAALMLSANPDLTPAQMKEILQETGTSLDSLNGKTSSGKMVNALTAVQRAKGLVEAQLTVSPTEISDIFSGSITLEIDTHTFKTNALQPSHVKLGGVFGNGNVTVTEFTYHPESTSKALISLVGNGGAKLPTGQGTLQIAAEAMEGSLQDSSVATITVVEGIISAAITPTSLNAGNVNQIFTITLGVGYTFETSITKEDLKLGGVLENKLGTVTNFTYNPDNLGQATFTINGNISAGTGTVQVSSSPIVDSEGQNSSVMNISFHSVAVGGGGGGGGGAPLTRVTDDKVIVEISPSRGGTVSLGKVKIEIPVNAFASVFKITVEKVKASTASSLSVAKNMQLVGDVFEITKDKAGNFEKTITITLPLDKSKVDTEKVDLAIFWYNEETKEWIKLDNMKVDVEAETVSGEVDHFTKFAVLAVEKEETPQTTPTVVQLTDIVGHWAEENIKKLVGKGVVNGYPDGSFKPDHNVTRAEFATILAQALELEAKEGKLFVDTANHWARESISTAYAYGIIQGYNQTTFAPNELITREQMAAMIVNALQLEGVTSSKTYVDQGNISIWAEKAVLTAVENEIITGYTDNTIKPKANATRAEAVTVILRALDMNK